MTTLGDDFHAALSAGRVSGDEALLPDALSRACLHVLPFDAAGLSLMSESTSRVPLGSSDETAARAERLQFTFGDGPCFRAMRSGEPVVVTEDVWTSQWPLMAGRHFEHTSYHGGLSVPLRVLDSWIGVLDLYSVRSRPVTEAVVRDAVAIATIVTAALLDTLGAAGEAVVEDHATQGAPVRSGAAWLWGAPTRRRGQVWIATGMANLALSLPSHDSLAVLRAHAFAEGVTLDALADDIVTGRFDVDALRTRG